ncbi:MAG: threonine aldolase, partial [Tardiphaga sp.]|nr:threonine aldolase [Tardiphaga sp.]
HVGVSAADMVKALRAQGVLLATMDGRIRACTHLDVTAAMIDEVLGLVREIARGA